MSRKAPFHYIVFLWTAFFCASVVAADSYPPSIPGSAYENTVRDLGNLNSRTAVESFIKGRLLNAGFDLNIQNFSLIEPTGGGTRTFPFTVREHTRRASNFWIEIPGKNQSGETIVIGGEYGEITDGKSAYREGRPYQATSAAALLTLAEAFKNGAQPDRTVRFVFFDSSPNEPGAGQKNYFLQAETAVKPLLFIDIGSIAWDLNETVHQWGMRFGDSKADFDVTDTPGVNESKTASLQTFHELIRAAQKYGTHSLTPVFASRRAFNPKINLARDYARMNGVPVLGVSGSVFADWVPINFAFGSRTVKFIRNLVWQAASSVGHPQWASKRLLNDMAQKSGDVKKIQAEIQKDPNYAIKKLTQAEYTHDKRVSANTFLSAIRKKTKQIERDRLLRKFRLRREIRK